MNRAEVVARGDDGVSLRARCIGRGEDLRRVADLLGAGERIVTLVGGGGIGKTTVAREIADRAIEAGEAVCWCELGEAVDPSGLYDAVGRALELSRPTSGHAALDQLGKEIAKRGQLLFVLDNVEQIVADAAEAVGRWCALAPGARFVVASREPLSLHGEVRHELGPLAIPRSEDELEQSDAGSLLISRIRRARRDFSIRAAERPLAIELLRVLEGIPLAIELAAPRVASLGLATVAARIGQGALATLGTGPRDALDRHATMRATIEWSWELLTPHEVSALAQCAAFRGGLTLDAAERVISLREHPEAPEVADILHGLREKSLLVPMRDAPTRLALYFGVREIAEERLGRCMPGHPLEGAYRRHAQHFVELGMQRAAGVRRHGGAACIRELRSERENLIAAADRALAADPPDASLAARAVLALWPVAQLEAAFHSLVPRIDAALAALGSSEAEPGLHAALLLTRGAIRWRAAQYDDAFADLAHAEQVAVTCDDRITLAQAQLQRAWALNRTHHPRARTAATEALASCERVGDLALEAEALRLLAGIVQDEGDVAEASRLGPRACDTAERSGDVPGTISALATQGVVELRRGDVMPASLRFERALALTEEVSYRPLDALLHGWLGVADLLRWRLGSSAMHLGRATAAFGRAGRPEYEGFFRSFLAMSLACDDREAEAREQAERARAILRPPVDVGDAPFPLAVLGMLDARAGNAEAAAIAFHEARRAIVSTRDEWNLAVDLYEALAHLAAARSARERREPFRERLAKVGEELERARRAHPDRSSSVVVRVAWTVLERALEDDERRGRASSRPRLRRVGTGALIVHERGDWFELPTGRRIDCRRRDAPARVLAHLARKRTDAPGTSVAIDELVTIGWPGEQVAWEAAVNRLRVAINLLRRLGLDAHVRNTRGGYLIDTSVTVRIERDPTE